MAAADIQAVLLAAAAGYFAGSVPFGLVLTRLAGLGDVRDIGSGNIGATNVLRTGRKGLAAATLLLDGGKGAAAVLVARIWGPEAALAAGLFAVLGHDFPIWLKFKGGKGVAATLGVLLGVSWPAGVLACLTWLLVAVVFRYSSLAALVALGAAPVFMLFMAGVLPAALAGVLAVLSIVRHQANIKRLAAGEEPKIGNKKKG